MVPRPEEAVVTEAAVQVAAETVPIINHVNEDDGVDAAGFKAEDIVIFLVVVALIAGIGFFFMQKKKRAAVEGEAQGDY